MALNIAIEKAPHARNGIRPYLSDRRPQYGWKKEFPKLREETIIDCSHFLTPILTPKYETKVPAIDCAKLEMSAIIQSERFVVEFILSAISEAIASCSFENLSNRF